MKTNKYILIIASMLLLIAACENEDKIRIPEPLDGANMRLIADPAHNQINYQTVQTDFFAFDAYSENKDLSKVEIFLQYQNQRKLVQTWSPSDFASGFAHFEFTAQDYADLFGVPGFADGSRGGNFTFSPRVTLQDGRVYPSYVHVSAQDSFLNIGTGITGAANGAFTIGLNTAITCAPVDISGAYTVVSASGTSTDGCCPGVVEVSGNTVQVTSTSATTFTVSDLTGGLYFEWYDVYGITSPNQTPGNLSFNCAEVVIVNSPEPFGTTFQGGGTYDAATKRIEFSWINGFADEATIILERQ
jgi:hypothetical protein